MIQDAASLLWVVNLGCIDLNQWYAKCDDVDRPDYLHFDLDPVPGAGFEQVRETALIVRDALDGLEIASYPKTTDRRAFTSMYLSIADLYRSKSGHSQRHWRRRWRRSNPT